VAITHFNIAGVAVVEAKAHAPLIVHRDGVLSAKVLIMTPERNARHVTDVNGDSRHLARLSVILP
jgi:hypothetical protein